MNLRPFYARWGLLLCCLPVVGMAADAGDQPPRPVEAVLPIVQPMPEEIVVTGTLRANESVHISPEIAGTVESLPFREGSAINKGDLIVELDDALLAAQLRQARASYDLAKLRNDRDRELVERNSISQSVYDESTAELNERRAALEVTQVMLEKTRISAPFDGYISLRNTSVGAYVTPGQELFEVVDDSILKLDFRVPERVAGTVKPGNQVTFILQSAIDGGEYQAVIKATEPVITPSSRTLMARAIFTNSDRKIRAGSFATVKLSLGAADPVPTVPEQALIGSAQGYHVFVVVDGRAERRNVTTGVRRGERIAIISGLDASLPVVIAGQQRLREGTPVEIVQVQD